MLTGIVGSKGVVGRNVLRYFPDAIQVDLGVGSYSDLSACDVVFICVPTPSTPDGHCNVQIVMDVRSRIDGPLVVCRSTVPPGTCEALNMVFQPEYIGETAAHPMPNDFVILGGARDDCDIVANLWKTVLPTPTRYYFTDAVAAELAKYMENSFYALKVTFVNEFADVADQLGVSFNELRELWLADTRISRDHTDVYPDCRGFDGKCLPKDLAALLAFSARTPLMRRVQEINNRKEQIRLEFNLHHEIDEQCIRRELEQRGGDLSLPHTIEILKDALKVTQWLNR